MCRNVVQYVRNLDSFSCKLILVSLYGFRTDWDIVPIKNSILSSVHHNLFLICFYLHILCLSLLEHIAQWFCLCQLVSNVLDGCAVGDYQMWQDVCLALDHEHASGFVSTILLLVLQKPSNPPCHKRKGRKAKWKVSTIPSWLLCFPRPKVRSSDLSERTSFSKERPGTHRHVQASRF